ncbi:MAG: N-acetylglucosamine-6-phosphate deacetylase [Muribaculaceae bacterium]|nr:N-acetylglucosamine-6-phosphate deacetylase [Muribaculaceae bacterium]
MTQSIVNGKLLMPDGSILSDGYITVTDDTITSIGKGHPDIESHSIIDAGGHYLSPGFIDLHTHGAGGADLMDGTVDSYLTVARTHARYGTTAFLPTTLTCPDEELFEAFRVFKEAKLANTDGARMLGLHLEGPYFAYSQRGAQDPANLKNPEPEHYNRIFEATDDILRWSVAPELPGAMEFGRILKHKGIIASVGHTDAITSEVIESHKNGYTLMTHFYSAMSGVTRRNAFRYGGAVEAGYLLDDMDVEIIADGIHLPKELLQLIYKIKGPDRIALITDSMRAAGMPEGEYKLGSLKEGQTVIVEDGVAKLMDRSAFAGSVATADRLVRTMVNIAEVPLTDAVRMITATPARILGMQHLYGSLSAGNKADIVIFDDNINIMRTIIGGKSVYKAID